MIKRPSIPLSTRVSPSHRSKLEQMKLAGFKITTVVEQGIDAVYSRLVQAGIVQDDGQAHSAVERIGS